MNYTYQNNRYEAKKKKKNQLSVIDSPSLFYAGISTKLAVSGVLNAYYRTKGSLHEIYRRMELIIHLHVCNMFWNVSLLFTARQRRVTS